MTTTDPTRSHHIAPRLGQRVAITRQGLDRIPGSNVGDTFLVESFTPSGDDPHAYVAHVYGSRPGTVWSLGVGDWQEIIGVSDSNGVTVMTGQHVRLLSDFDSREYVVVQVGIGDGPLVSIRPVDSSPDDLGLGTLAGDLAVMGSAPEAPENEADRFLVTSADGDFGLRSARWIGEARKHEHYSGDYVIASVQLVEVARTSVAGAVTSTVTLLTPVTVEVTATPYDENDYADVSGRLVSGRTGETVGTFSYRLDGRA